MARLRDLDNKERDHEVDGAREFLNQREAKPEPLTPVHIPNCEECRERIDDNAETVQQMLMYRQFHYKPQRRHAFTASAEIPAESTLAMPLLR